MLPMDPLIAFSQAKATMAERHAESARQRMAGAARSKGAHSVVNTPGGVARLFAAAIGLLRSAVSARNRAPHGQVGEEPRTVAG